MRLLTGARHNAPTRSLQDRLVWQCASLLLAYPDEHFAERLGIVEELRVPVAGRAAQMLARTVEALRARDPMHAAADYVDTFDLRRRSTMYLTYWTAGDTRNRGREMHAFAQAYRDAGSRPPVDEAPGSPSGRARVRGDRRPRCGAAAAGRAPGADRRAARCVDRMRIAIRPHHFRGVRDDTGRHRPGRATGAAAGAGRAAHRSGWPATVHADGAPPRDRRRPVT